MTGFGSRTGYGTMTGHGTRSGFGTMTGHGTRSGHGTRTGYGAGTGYFDDERCEYLEEDECLSLSSICRWSSYYDECEAR